MAEGKDPSEGGDAPFDLLEHTRPRLGQEIDIDQLTTTGCRFTWDSDMAIALFDEEDDHEYEMFRNTLGDPAPAPERNATSALHNFPYQADCGNFDRLVDSMEDISIQHDRGLLKKVLQTGAGVQIQDKSMVDVHYVAFCEDKHEPLDTTLLNGRPSRFKLDLDDPTVIPGYHYAFMSMKVGEVSKFIMDHHYGYGEMGCPPRVDPACRILVFVEMLHTFLCKDITIARQSKEERALMSFSVIEAEAVKFKSEGNSLYGLPKYQAAIHRYRLAKEMLEDFPVKEEADEEKRNKLLFALYLNMAQCYNKLGKSAQACVACKNALRIRESEEIKKLHYKIYYRFAFAKFELGSYADAKWLCEKAMKEGPEKKDFKKLMDKINEKIKKDDSDLNRLYKKMMGVTEKPKSDTPSSSKNVPNVKGPNEDSSDKSSTSML